MVNNNCTDKEKVNHEFDVEGYYYCSQQRKILQKNSYDDCSFLERITIKK